MLTHMHKVIHLVVGTFEQGGGVSEVEETLFGDRTQDQTLDLHIGSALHSEGHSRLVTGR
jgi:hypothetical protein